jgi:hypothetical protein
VIVNIYVHLYRELMELYLHSLINLHGFILILTSENASERNGKWKILLVYDRHRYRTRYTLSFGMHAPFKISTCSVSGFSYVSHPTSFKLTFFRKTNLISSFVCTNKSDVIVDAIT